MFSAVQKISAQKTFFYDTVRVQEFQFGITPALFVLLGASDFGNSAVSFAYQHYFKNYKSLRGKLAFFPFREASDLENVPVFNRSIDTLNVFSSNHTAYLPTGQISLAYEKFFRIGKQAHSWQFELGYQHQNIFVNQTYVWYPNTMQLNATNLSKFTNGDTLEGNQAGKIYNKVDSLSYNFLQVTQSIGIHLAYAMRHQFNSRWYILANIGPSFYFRQSRRSEFMGASSAAKFPSISNFDAQLLVSEVSLAYRF